MPTIIRVKHRHGPYVVIDRRVLEDKRLTWAARGILGYLLAKPNDWELRVEDLRRAALTPGGGHDWQIRRCSSAERAWFETELATDMAVGSPILFPFHQSAGGQEMARSGRGRISAVCRGSP